MKIDKTNNDVKRIYYGLEQHFNKKCKIMLKEDYLDWIQTGDTNLKYDSPPEPLKNVMCNSTVVAIYASEMENINIFREHQKDKPQIYNLDRYTVFINLHLTTAFPSICQKAGVQDTPDLRKSFRDYVFIVGPYKDEPHHFEKIPEYFREKKD